MSRPVFVGNGRMLVGINKFGLVHDFYYPYVGLENHTAGTGLRHKIGIWVDDTFTWLDDGSWRFKLDYEEDAMIGYSFAFNDALEIALELHDFVDNEHNMFGRNIHVVNKSDRPREIRLFMHQVLQISESARGDTALYVPDDHVILDYKGNRAFVVYGEDKDGNVFDQYSIGNFGIEGKEGTYRDAEDGRLEANPVEHGHIDSVIRFTLNLNGNSSTRVHYWIVAASNNVEALRIHQQIKKVGLDARYRATQTHWNKWLNQVADKLHLVDEADLPTLKKSLFIMKSHMDARGAVIASGDSQMLNYARDYYSYCWPRDASHVLWPFIRLGFKNEPRAYFEFARDVLTEGGYFMHKYLPDRSIGSSWHPYVHEHHKELPIQEDETAITIFMLAEYLRHSGDETFVESLYTTLVRPAANFIEQYMDKETRLPHASYDLWEERFQTTTYTVGVVYGALLAAAEMAERFMYPDDAIRWETLAADIKETANSALFNTARDYFYRGYLLTENGMIDHDDTVDVASFYGATKFGLFDQHDPKVTSSFVTLKNTLLDKSPAGGLPRYEYDNYNKSEPAYLGNPWFVTTLWYAQQLCVQGNVDEAKSLLEWTRSHMLKSAVLPEQIRPEDGSHVSVAPLIWSHAEYVTTILDTIK